MKSSAWWKLRSLLSPGLRPLRTRGLYVLGMHRSGTSCLTGLLETAGLFAGSVRGLYEDRSIRLLNRDLLAKAGGTWRDPPERIEIGSEEAARVRNALRPFSDHPEWILKDPRFLFTLDAWTAHTPNHRLVGTYRHPLSVAHSLEKRDRKLREEDRRKGESPLSVEEGVRIWCAYNRNLVRLQQQRGLPIIDFDLDGPEYLACLRKVFELLGLEYDSRAVAERYDVDRISNRFADQDLSGEAKELYQALKGCALR
ncbi:MAG: hypothetical protein V2A76_16935 [Planctomycetota bacterium]